MLRDSIKPVFKTQSPSKSFLCSVIISIKKRGFCRKTLNFQGFSEKFTYQKTGFLEKTYFAAKKAGSFSWLFVRRYGHSEMDIVLRVELCSCQDF